MSGSGCCFVLWFPEGSKATGMELVEGCTQPLFPLAGKEGESCQGPGQGRKWSELPCSPSQISAGTSLSSDQHTPVGSWPEPNALMSQPLSLSSGRRALGSPGWFLREGKGGCFGSAPATPQSSLTTGQGRPTRPGWVRKILLAAIF